MQTLRTHVEFCSDVFPQTPTEIEKWNGQIWGENLTKYLIEQLNQCGITTNGYVAEDWGYVIYLERDQYQPIWIGCGYYEEYHNGFLIFLNPSRPIIRQWFFKKIDISEQLIKLSNIIDKILKNNPNIHHIKWWENNER